MNNKDLQVTIDNTVLNIRAVVIIETKSGYLFEQSPDKYYFSVGGKIKVNETSEDAVRREIREELGIKIGDIKMKAVIENFFLLHEAVNFHELNFVFTTFMEDEIKLPKNYYYFSKDELSTLDIRPKAIKEVIMSDGEEFIHIVNDVR